MATAATKDRVGILVPPPAYPLLGLAASWAVQRWLLPLPAPPTGARLLGGALALAAVALALWAVAALTRERTPVDPYRATTAIVRRGPYRFTRNPIYVGFVLGEAGIGLALGWWWALPLAVLVAVALDRLVIRREEAYLARKFGHDYDAYRATVRRWL